MSDINVELDGGEELDVELDTSITIAGVASVNGKTGVVVLDADDVGAQEAEEGKGLSTNDYTNEDKAKVHTHDNKSILDGIIQSVVAAWNNAVSWITTNGTNLLNHLSNTTVHLTSTEKSNVDILGNAVTNAGIGYTTSTGSTGITINWDGVTTGKSRLINDEEYGEYVAYKISESIVNHSSFIGGNFTYVDDGVVTTVQITSEHIGQYSDDGGSYPIYEIGDDTCSWIVIVESNCTYEGFSIAAGVYFYSYEDGWITGMSGHATSLTSSVSVQITWDGNTTGRTQFPDGFFTIDFYKVGEAVRHESMIGGSVTVDKDGLRENLTISSENLVLYADDSAGFYIMGDSDYEYIVLIEEDMVYVETSLTAGIYFCKSDTDTRARSLSTSVEPTVVDHAIASKYLPSGLCALPKVTSITDWNQFCDFGSAHPSLTLPDPPDTISTSLEIHFTFIADSTGTLTITAPDDCYIGDDDGITATSIVHESLTEYSLYEVSVAYSHTDSDGAHYFEMLLHEYSMEEDLG